MKKLIFGVLMLALSGVSAQSHDGHAPCSVNNEAENAYLTNPTLKVQDSIDQANFELEYQQYLNDYDPFARSLYVIPVVFHIVHLDGPENISDEQVYDALAKLNEDYSMSNTDLSAVIPSFASIIGNPDIEFRLATKDPNQNCHTGITRTYSPYTVDDGTGQTLNAVANQHGVWPQNRYLNIFVVADPNGNAGYTNYPASWYSASSMEGGIYLRHDYCGTIGTGSTSNRRTISHECAHWLNIRHVWGNSNTAGDAGNCSMDDLVNDTPITIGNPGSCDLAANSCSSLDNIQNIMDYTGSCRRMFTQGQAARMHTALNNSTAQRNNLHTPANLTLTGTDGPGDLCMADFSSDYQVICAGQAVQFTDDSYHNVTARTWTFTGGTPATSGLENPTVTYSTAGIYEVKLEITDGSSNLTKTEPTYIVVMGDPGEGLPYSEGFETVSAVPDLQNWFVYDASGTDEWELTGTGAGGSSKSAKLNNYGNSDGSIDELISSTIDLSGVDLSDNIVFNFEYAYRKRISSNNEKLQFFISKNCGETWVLRKNISGDNLSSVTATSAYTPSGSEDWYSVDVTNINSDYYVSNFRYKFVFTNDNGNNVFIDNINISSGAMADIETQTATTNIAIFPNPTKDNTMLRMSNVAIGNYQIDLMSMDGKLITNLFFGEIENNNKELNINTSTLSKGIYFVRIQDGNRLETIKLIKE